MPSSPGRGSSQRTGKSWERTGRTPSCRFPRGGRPAGKRIWAVAQNRSGTWSKGAFESGEKAGLQQHVIIQQADVGAAGAGDAAVDGAREGERSCGVDHFDLRVGRGEPFGGAIGAAVVDNDDLAGRLCEDAGKLGCEQFLAGAGGDDDRDAGPGPAGMLEWTGQAGRPRPTGRPTFPAREAASVTRRAGTNPSSGRCADSSAGCSRRATPCAARSPERDPGRSMKWLRFSLKARKPRGERASASRRMRRNGTLGTSITPARRIS